MPTVTLQQVLATRDERVARQKSLLSKYHCTVVSLTVVSPGSIKRTEDNVMIAHIGESYVEEHYGKEVKNKIITDKATGYEIMWAIDASPNDIKRACVQLENLHPLGRLLDIDVINMDGKSISREEIGESPRKCLLCDQLALHCIRARTHTTDDVLAKIKKMIALYKQSK